MTEEDDLIKLLYDLDTSSNDHGRYGYDQGNTKKEIFSELSCDTSDTNDILKTSVKLETKQEEEDDFDYQDSDFEVGDQATAEYDSDLSEDNFGGCEDMDVEPDPVFMDEHESDDGQSGLQSACKFRCSPCGLDFNTWAPTKKHIKDKHVDDRSKKVRYDINEYLVEARHHKCSVCEETVLQDLVIVMSHVRNKHNMSAQEYREVQQDSTG